MKNEDDDVPLSVLAYSTQIVYLKAIRIHPHLSMIPIMTKLNIALIAHNWNATSHKELARKGIYVIFLSDSRCQMLSMCSDPLKPSRR